VEYTKELNNHFYKVKFIEQSKLYMSDFLNELNSIYGDQSKKISVFRVGETINVSSSVFGIRGSSTCISVRIVKVYANGNLSVKPLDSNIIKVVYPSQVRN